MNAQDIGVLMSVYGQASPSGDVSGDGRSDALDLAQISRFIGSAGMAQVYYLHNDHLGTPKVATDQSGQVVWRANYDPFGKATLNSANSITVNLRFPGQYYDQETGLHYNYFRYMDPETGRYITADPIGLQGGLNTYAYVGGNPIKYYDPNGRISVCVGLATAAAIVDLWAIYDVADYSKKEGKLLKEIEKLKMERDEIIKEEGTCKDASHKLKLNSEIFRLNDKIKRLSIEIAIIKTERASDSVMNSIAVGLTIAAGIACFGG